MAFDDSDGGGGGAISQINVTPLVDVMLVLLVIFMVTAPIIQQGVAINLPKVTSAALPGEDEQLVVSVDKAGKVFLNDTAMELGDLTSKLQAILLEQPQRQVFVRADAQVPYGDVMKMIAALKDGGIERVGLVTEPPADEEG